MLYILITDSTLFPSCSSDLFELMNVKARKKKEMPANPIAVVTGTIFL